MKTVASGVLTKMKDRLQELINLGEIALVQHPPPEQVPMAKYQEWRLASESFLESVVGASSRYFTFFQERVESWPPFTRPTIELGLGALRGVNGEIECGPLPNVEGLISAEVFEDFLDMAEHLLEQGYIQVVPSLAGAVLEDSLKRIAKNHGIPVRAESDNIASLNNKLADATIYSNFIRKKIELWAATRNNADHGKFDENKEQDVRQMLEGVRDFLSTYLQ